MSTPEIESRVKREIAITRYLRDTYGLDDYSTLDAGEVEELCFMIVEELLTTHDAELREKIEGIIKLEILDNGGTLTVNNIQRFYGLKRMEKPLMYEYEIKLSDVQALLTPKK
jgi:hypothetical protein